MSGVGEVMAVAELVGTVNKVIGKVIWIIKTLKDAPNTLFSLAKALSNCQVYVSEASKYAYEQNTIPDTKPTKALQAAVDEAKETILELDQFIEYELTKPLPGGGVRVSKSKVLRSGHTIGDFRVRLDRVEQKIANALSFTKPASASKKA